MCKVLGVHVMGECIIEVRTTLSGKCHHLLRHRHDYRTDEGVWYDMQNAMKVAL